MLDRMDILDYAIEKGLEAAADLLLLAGPDGYAGDYWDMEETLRKAISAQGS